MDCPRQKRERLETMMICSHGALSSASRGRAVPEPPCPMRTCFQRDVDRITHCKAFRRLKHKTQVFLQPEGDHYRTRLTHTLEVTRLARTIARALEVNEDLTEAIGLGHDLGHTPFGHAGERALLHIAAGVTQPLDRLSPATGRRIPPSQIHHSDNVGHTCSIQITVHCLRRRAGTAANRYQRMTLLYQTTATWLAGCGDGHNACGWR